MIYFVPVRLRERKKKSVKTNNNSVNRVLKKKKKMGKGLVHPLRMAYGLAHLNVVGCLDFET